MTTTPKSQAAAIDQAGAPADRWTCFHCGESFTDRESAALHFGRTERQEPICGVSQERYREMELRMEEYNAEDANIHRQMAAMQTKHRQALRRAEEDGYAKGLRDAVRFPVDVAPAGVQQADDPEGKFALGMLTQLHRMGASPAGLSLAAQLFGVGPCEKCGYRKLYCRCPAPIAEQHALERTM